MTALDKSNFNKIKSMHTQQATPENGLKDTASTPAAAKTEVVPVGQNGGQDSALVAYIKTLLNLPDDEIFKNLKGQFKNVADATLKATIAQVKIAAGENGNGENHEITMNTKEPEDIGVVSAKAGTAKENSEISAEAKVVEDTNNLSEEELLLINYAERLKKPSDGEVKIEDVIMHLKDIPADKLTEDEKKILEYIEASRAEAIKSISRKDLMKIFRENSEALENLIPKEVKESAEWNKKSVVERLDARIDAILEKKFPGYSKLPEGSSKPQEMEEGTKAYYRNKFYDEMGQIVFDGEDKQGRNGKTVKGKKWDALSDIEKQHAIQKAAIAIDAAEKSGIPLKDLLDPVNGKKLMGKAIAQYGMDNVIAKFVKSSVDVESDEWKNKTLSEQTHEIADEIISGIDKDYLKLSEKERKTIRNMWIDELARKIYPNWDELTTAEKKDRQGLFVKDLCAIKFLGKTPSEYFSKPLEERLWSIEEYEQMAGIDLKSEEMVFRYALHIGLKTGKVNDRKLSIYNEDILRAIDALEKEMGGQLPEDIALMRAERMHAKSCGMNFKERPPESALDHKFNIRDFSKRNVSKFIDERILCGRNLSEVSDDELRASINMIRNHKLRLAVCKALGKNPEEYIDLQNSVYMAGAGIHEGNEELGIVADKSFALLGRHDLIDHTIIGMNQSKAFENNDDALLRYNEAAAMHGEQHINQISKCWNDQNYFTTERATKFTVAFAKSTNVPDSAKSMMARDMVRNASDDSIKVHYSDALSQTGNAATLEGLAAASGYVSDPGMRNQYNSHITTAASNLPPEDQARITTAMQTGQISKETLSKTSTSNSNSSQSSQSTSKSSQASQSTQSQTTKAQASSAQAASQTTQAQAPKATTTTQTQAPKVNVTISQNIQRMYQEATNSYTQKVYDQIKVLEKESEENKAKVEKEAREAEAKREKERLEKSVQSSENMRQEAMAKAKEVQENIQASVEEWEARHKKLTTEDGATVSASIVIGLAEDMISDSNLPAEEKENLKQQVFKASSIEEIYDILASRAIEISSVIEKVMSLLESSSSSTATKAVAELVKTSEGRKLLYKIAPAEEYVLSEVLSEDEVFSLLDSNEIKHIGYVNESTLIRYIKKNIYLMPNWKFSRYLKYLSLDDREALVEKRNKEKGIITQTTVPSGENHEADMVTVARVEEENQENKIFKNNERTTTLADGTMITKEGSGFGAVSDNDYETSRIIQPKKKEEGAPIGMNDDVLTVGSAEWNLKYNKGNVQSTAFTMAAMEEDDEDDGVGNFMSTKGNFKGRKIKKKYRSSGFNAMG